MRFDTVIVADWSAAGSPSPARESADAIWIGIARAGTAEVQYHRTRRAAEAALAGMIVGEAAAGRRLLVGFDFPMGYPAGFASRLTATAAAPAVWSWMESAICDDARNANNRFAVAGGINRGFGGAGPFWGCPRQRPVAGLPERRPRDYAAFGLAERRAVERLVSRAQPVWKLYTTGAVGSQVLVGLPMIARLSRLPGVAVWPFSPHHDARTVIAEIYPSLMARGVAHDMAAGETIKDRAQVRRLSLALWRLAAEAALDPLFVTPDIAREEGWILGAGHADLLEAAVP